MRAHNMATKKKIKDATDDCVLISRINKKIGIVRGEYRNVKITTKAGFRSIETSIKTRGSVKQ